MAYYDENGKITIDEVAANKDIKRLREAAQILKESQASIRALQRQSSEMQGLTAKAIQEKGLEMEKKLGQMISKLESTADYIQKVVANYRKKDEELKRLIQAQKIVAQTVKTGKSSIQNINKTSESGVTKAVEAARESSAKDAALKESAQKAAKVAQSIFDNIFK